MNAATAFHRPSSPFGAAGVKTDRANEYDAFARVTRQLMQADVAGTGRAASDAVHRNTLLWSTLATDLSQPGNALPDDLKAGLLSLAIFSIRHGLRVAAGDAGLQPLIDVNGNIMAGLRERGVA